MEDEYYGDVAVQMAEGSGRKVEAENEDKDVRIEDEYDIIRPPKKRRRTLTYDVRRCMLREDGRAIAGSYCNTSFYGCWLLLGINIAVLGIERNGFLHADTDAMKATCGF